MENIIQLAEKLNQLIEQNKNLKESLERTEEYLKLAICLTGSLNFRTIGNADKEVYQNFINNTFIAYGGNSSGGIQLIWNSLHPLELDGRTVASYAPVTIEEIEKIFNSKSVNEAD